MSFKKNLFFKINAVAARALVFESLEAVKKKNSNKLFEIIQIIIFLIFFYVFLLIFIF